MRGKFLHNRVLVAPVAQLCRSLGAEVVCECAVRSGEGIGYVDVVADWRNWRLVIEAELTARRVGNDVRKAIVLDADYLLLIAPHRRIADAIKRKVDAVSAQGQLRICVLPLGPALQWVRNTCHLMSQPNVSTTFNQKIPVRNPKTEAPYHPLISL